MRLACLFCAALPMAAGAGQSKEAVVSALAAHDCRVAPAEVPQVFAPEGFTPGFVRGVLTGMILDGTASEDAEGTLSLPPSICPPEKATGTPRDDLLRRFAENGCRLGTDDLDAIRADLGVEDAQLRAIVQPLYESGALSVSGRQAELSDDLCPTGES